MHCFDYNHLKSGEYVEMAGLTNILFDLRAREEIRENYNKSVFESLRRAAIIDSVESSNAIEGVVAPRNRLKGIIAGTSSPISHDEHEIAGYSMALNEIYNPIPLPDISEEYIRHLHYLILGQTSADAGQYKDRNNRIQERDENGSIGVRFVPVPAKDTADAMEQLVMAYYEARQDSNINSLLLTACFIVDFLCIHPFMDGNGRVSRLLTALLLQEIDFGIGKYISLDKKINYYKENYYQVLRESSDGWHENKNSYKPFILFFLQILYQCYKEVDDRFVKSTVTAVPKSKQIELALLNTFTPVSKHELCERFPEISVKTIEKVLGEMVKDGRVVKIGTFRDARYKKF